MAYSFGDAVDVTDPSGHRAFAKFLAGPRAHEGRQVIWVCDTHEWDISQRFGRDPEGTAVPPESVGDQAPYVHGVSVMTPLDQLSWTSG